MGQDTGMIAKLEPGSDFECGLAPWQCTGPQNGLNHDIPEALL